jgi:hypothetical protein
LASYSVDAAVFRTTHPIVRHGTALLDTAEIRPLPAIIIIDIVKTHTGINGITPGMERQRRWRWHEGVKLQRLDDRCIEYRRCEEPSMPLVRGLSM